MASLRQIRRRMRSIENIHDITKAMEMIAAFRYKKAENRFTRARAYFSEMEKLIANLSGSVMEIRGPFFEKGEIRKKALVVMTGDKGLCGVYNTNLFRSAALWLRQNAETEANLIPVGKMGSEHFKKKGMPILAFYPEKSSADMALAKRITNNLKDLFFSGKADSVEILYTSFRAGGTGQNRQIPFLGLSYLLESREEAVGNAEYILEPDFESVFKSLVENYLDGKMFALLLESLTSEYSARMIAMKQATENGEEVLDNLRLLRNKTRQATITRELTEIVSGANALL